MDDPLVPLFDYISFLHAVTSIELTLVISPSAALASLLVALLPPFFVCVGPLKPIDDFTFLVDSGFWPFDRKARPLEDPTAVRGIWTDAHGLPDRTKKRTKAADSRGIIKHTRYQNFLILSFVLIAPSEETKLTRDRQRCLGAFYY